jgi:hypothetical protein
MARRPGNLYTLGDLLPAIGNKKLKPVLRAERLLLKPDGGEPAYESKPLAGIIEGLSKIMQARNVFGCHFNALSFQMLESDAIPFGEKVLELAELIVDEEAGWPAKKQKAHTGRRPGRRVVCTPWRNRTNQCQNVPRS